MSLEPDRRALVSAYIPCFNNAATLAAAIDGILRQSVPVDDFFIVNDGSTDASREIAASLGVRVVEMKANLGRGAARARAMEEAKHEFVLCCDATNRLREDFLERALPWMENAKVAGIIGRLIDDKPSGMLGRWRARHLFHQDEAWTEPRRDNLSTWGTLMRKSATLGVGNFDPALRFAEDAELGRRLVAAGFDVFFDPNLIVATQTRNSLGQVMERFFRWNRDEPDASPLRAFVRAQSYAARHLAVKDLRAGDPGAALISLLTPYYGLWNRHPDGQQTISRKLLTKPIWWLERNRPYPIRRAWTKLPPVRGGEGSVPFVVLTTPPDFDDAMWCAWSWLRFIGPEVRLAMYVDGDIGPREREAVAKHFPGGAILDAREVVAKAMHGFPVLLDYGAGHATGRKMSILLELQKTTPLIYCDYDVPAFSPPVEIVECLRNSAAGAYMQEEGAGIYDPMLVRRAEELGLAPLPSFNAGLMVLQKGCLDPAAVNMMYEGWRESTAWWMEQTVLACLLSKVPMIPLPRERYVLSNARQFYWQTDVADYDRIAARHFTTPTRHVMYMKGLPRLLRAVR